MFHYDILFSYWIIRISQLGSHRNEMESWVSRHNEGAMQPCLIQFGIVSVKILTQFLPLNTNKSFQTVCFGPFISPGVHKDHVFDVNIKILLGEEVCSQALGSRSLELQACGACCSISLQRAFHLLLAQCQKALWRSSNLSSIMAFLW